MIKYLGRYTHKTAITHYRIQSVKNDTVYFEYKDYADGNKIKEMELTAEEFVQRFERHILPKRFVRIRHYGFLTNRGKAARINEIRNSMGLEPVTLKVEVPIAVKMLEKFGKDITQCQQCQTGRYELLFTKRFDKITYRRARAAPSLEKLKN